MAYIARKRDDETTPSQALQAQSQTAQTGVKSTGVSAPTQSKAGVATNTTPESFTRSGYSSPATIIERNRTVDASGIAKRLLGNSESEAQRRTGVLNTQGADYLDRGKANANTTYRGIDQNAINAALGGDSAQAGRIQGALNRPGADKVTGPELERFDPLKDAGFYQQDGVGQTLQRAGGSGYTRGMAGLDAALVKRTGVGQQVRGQVAGLQQGVDAARNRAAGRQSELQGYADQAAKTQVGNLRSNLNQNSMEILGQTMAARHEAEQRAPEQMAEWTNANKADADNRRENVLRSLRNSAYEAGHYGQLYEPLIEQLEKADLSQLLNNKVTRNANPSFGDYANPDDAKRYNTIQEWLGSGDRLQSGGNPLLSNAYSGDEVSKYLDSLVNPALDDIRKRTVTAKTWDEKQDEFMRARAAKEGPPTPTRKVSPAEQAINTLNMEMYKIPGTGMAGGIVNEVLMDAAKRVQNSEKAQAEVDKKLKYQTLPVERKESTLDKVTNALGITKAKEAPMSAEEIRSRETIRKAKEKEEERRKEEQKRSGRWNPTGRK